MSKKINYAGVSHPKIWNSGSATKQQSVGDGTMHGEEDPSRVGRGRERGEGEAMATYGLLGAEVPREMI